MLNSNVPNIAVIGAGIAGLTAASRLSKAGFRITVFEKSRGPGGRCTTRRERNYRFDHGAQYFTLSDPRFADQVKIWKRENIITQYPGQIVAIHGNEITRESRKTARYVGVPGMNAIAKHLAQNLEISYRNTIVSISKSQDQWYLKNQDHESFGPFDFVIISAPPAQTANLIPDNIAVKSRIKQIKMMPCWAVMAVFNRPAATEFDAAFLSESILSWICRNNSKPGRPEPESWILHGSYAWSQQNLEQTQAQIINLSIAEFKRITRSKGLKLVFSTAHRWRYAQVEKDYGVDFILDSDNRLGICGEWLKFSKVEGAYLSGLMLAEAIL